MLHLTNLGNFCDFLSSPPQKIASPHTSKIVNRRSSPLRSRQALVRHSNKAPLRTPRPPHHADGSGVFLATTLQMFKKGCDLLRFEKESPSWKSALKISD